MTERLNLLSRQIENIYLFLAIKQNELSASDIWKKKASQYLEYEIFQTFILCKYL